MNSWSAFQNSVSSLSAQIPLPDLNSTTAKLSTRFQTLSQTVKERTGAASLDITELPQEYLDLERRVDGLRTAHVSILRVAKVYDTAYDYPSQLQESVTELSGSLVHNLSSLMAAATKGTNLPQPPVTEKPVEVHKTLPHALSRAAATSAIEVAPSRLSSVLKTFAEAQDKIGEARVEQDDAIVKNFLQPWSATLNSSLQAAIKSRANVKTARISLDACRGVMKNATGGPRQEQARLEVEAAEEKLVNATEEAINLMRSVLENPEPIKNLRELIKAQQAYHAAATEVLSGIDSEIEELGVQAEADYRKSRAQ